MSPDLNLSSVLDQYKKVEEKLVTSTQEHPVVMLGAATGLGFIVGMMGIARAFQLGFTLSAQDKFSLQTVKEFFEKKDSSLNSSQYSPSAHA